MDKPNLNKGGKALRAIRESKRLSQLDVHDQTGIQLSRLSYIDRGLVAKPPSILDMAQLGMLYGLSPRSLFEIYGLPIARTAIAAESGSEDPEELVALRTVLKELTDGANRAEILGMVGWVVDMANAKIATLAKGESDTEPTQRRVVRAKA